jgi:CheY-like chemotaxis protein
LHGGTVEARSAGIGHGSEFIVRLPRLRRDDVAEDETIVGDTSPAPLDAPGRHAPRILVVDDNIDGAATLAELLQMLGCSVHVANDGGSALALVGELAPDVVLLDIGLPDLNGYEVARRVRAMNGIEQPRLIALTGWGQEQDKRLAAQAGFDDHWTKPVDPMRLQQLAAR